MISPEDLLDEAKALLGLATSSEARRRTIIGRAYYAAFHFLRSHECCKHYQEERGLGTHRNLINYLSESRSLNVLFAARILNSLYSYRCRADYMLNMDIERGLERRAVEDTEDIFNEALVEYDATEDVRDSKIGSGSKKS